MIKWILLVMSFSMISNAKEIPQFSYNIGDIVNEEGAVVKEGVSLTTSWSFDRLEELETVDCALGPSVKNQKLFFVVNDRKIIVNVLINDSKTVLFCESTAVGNIRKVNSLFRSFDDLSEAEIKAMLTQYIIDYEYKDIKIPDLLEYEETVIPLFLEKYFKDETIKNIYK